MLWHLPKARLDLLATAGLPIWVTELDVVHTDISIRADGYEMAYRIFFSHPGVDGILTWGFWDGAMNADDASLVDGPDFEVNEAGQRYLAMIHEEWNTQFSWQPESQQDQYQTRAFQGGYELTVLYDDVPIQSQEFYVNKGESQTVYVDID